MVTAGLGLLVVGFAGGLGAGLWLADRRDARRPAGLGDAGGRVGAAAAGGAGGAAPGPSTGVGGRVGWWWDEWLGGPVVKPEPSSIRQAEERYQLEIEAQSGIVRSAVPGWRATTRELEAFWARNGGTNGGR